MHIIIDDLASCGGSTSLLGAIKICKICPAEVEAEPCNVVTVLQELN